MKPKIVVIGSANMDLIVRTAHFPRAGETVLGGNYIQSRGGKGANQAVAAARLGADVTFVARLGKDQIGQAGGSRRKERSIVCHAFVSTGEGPTSGCGGNSSK